MNGKIVGSSSLDSIDLNGFINAKVGICPNLLLSGSWFLYFGGLRLGLVLLGLVLGNLKGTNVKTISF